MRKFLDNIEYYIDQYDIEKQLFKQGIEILKRGWLTKEEFLNICYWKSRRPKNLYLSNSEEDIKKVTNLALNEIDETKKITMLTTLKGVSIPTASAILSVTNPKDYPIIDERCIQSLNELQLISWKSINKSTWINYLNLIRNISKNTNKNARDIEKALFSFNRMKLDKESKNLYK